MTGKKKEKADEQLINTAQQILTGSGRMKEVEMQDSEQATSSRIKNLCACLHMLWFSSVSIRQQAKKFLEEPRAPDLTSNSL